MGEPSIGRPALAYVPVPPESPLPGRLHVLSMRRHAERTTVRERMLTARLTRTGSAIGFGSGSEHDNSWFYGYGVDLLFEPGVDTNLRSLISVKPYKMVCCSPRFSSSGRRPTVSSTWLSATGMTGKCSEWTCAAPGCVGVYGSPLPRMGMVTCRLSHNHRHKRAPRPEGDSNE